MHQNRGINRTFVPIIVRVGLTLPVFPPYIINTELSGARRRDKTDMQ